MTAGGIRAIGGVGPAGGAGSVGWADGEIGGADVVGGGDAGGAAGFAADGAGRVGGARGLALATVLGALAAACSVGLLATAAWLISRSAQRPAVLFLIAPAAVVQAFGFGRALFRYAERLAGHNAALGLLAARRVRAYECLARLAPAGLADHRSGDLIARLVTDVDSLADRWLRVRLPFAAAVVAGAGAVALVTALQPEAGLVLAATLAVSALAAPAVAIALSRREERSLAPLRGDLAAAIMELLDGAAELTVFGAAGRALAAVQSNAGRIREATARSGYGRGAGAAVGALATGTALLGAVVFAVPAVRSGALAGVLLAVVVLTPLAAHEVFAGLGPAAQEIPGLRAAGRPGGAVARQARPGRRAGRSRAAAGTPLRAGRARADGRLGAGRARPARRQLRRPGRVARRHRRAVRVGQDHPRPGAAPLP